MPKRCAGFHHFGEVNYSNPRPVVHCEQAAYVFNNMHISVADQRRFAHLVDMSIISSNNSATKYGSPYKDACRVKSHIETTKLLKPYIFEPYFAPGMMANVTGLPKTVVLFGSHTPTRDENLIFAQRLHESGVSVTTEVHRHTTIKDICCLETGSNLRKYVVNVIKSNVWNSW